MTWALWGKARTRRDNDLVHLGTGEMYVQLDFMHEGQTYRVIRRRSKRGSSGTGRLDLFSYNGAGELTEIRESTMTATQNRITDLLRLDYETFVNSAFLQQGQADLFTTQPPAKRKQILSNILGLEAWTMYEDAAKQQRDHYKGLVQNMEGRLSEIEDELAKEDDKKQELADAKQAHEAVKEQLDAAEKLLDDVKDAPAQLKQAKDSRAETARRRDEQQRELDNVNATLKQQAEKIAEYKSILDSREEIESGYESLQTAREQSQVLNEKLRKLKGIDEQISQQQNQLTAEQTRLESERDTLTKQIAELDKQISAAETDDLATVQAELAALEAKSEEREEKQAAVAALGEEDATVRQENVSLYEKMTEIRERLDNLKTVDGAECPLCGQDLTEAHRAELLEELEAEGKDKGDTYRANQQRMKDIEAEKKSLTAAVKTLTDELAALPRLQKREGELAAQKQAAEDATRQRETAQKRLDEVQRQLAEDDFAPEIRGELNALREQKQALGYDEDAHDEQDEALKTYQRFEDLRNQLNVAENSLETVQQAYDANQARKERLTKAIADLDEEIAALDGEVEKLAALEETFREREKTVAQLRTKESQVKERVIIAEQALRALDAKREQKKKYEEQRAAFAEQHGIYDELRTAFGKNGVPAMIIETAIPELEATTNDLLMRMTDGRMAVTFSTQREKVTGGTMETLDIGIADELGTRDYEMYSGGEAFRINFAIRVALSKMLRGGPAHSSKRCSWTRGLARRTRRGALVWWRRLT